MSALDRRVQAAIDRYTTPELEALKANVAKTLAEQDADGLLTTNAKRRFVNLYRDTQYEAGGDMLLARALLEFDMGYAHRQSHALEMRYWGRS